MARCRKNVAKASQGGRSSRGRGSASNAVREQTTELESISDPETDAGRCATHDDPKQQGQGSDQQQAIDESVDVMGRGPKNVAKASRGGRGTRGRGSASGAVREQAAELGSISDPETETGRCATHDDPNQQGKDPDLLEALEESAVQESRIASLRSLTKERVRDHGGFIIEKENDGPCLFWALAFLGDCLDGAGLHDDEYVRGRVVDTLDAGWGQIAGNVEEPQADRVARMRGPKEFGEREEVKAAANYFKVQIEVIHPFEGSPTLIPCDGPSSGVWKLAWDGAKHYEAVIEGTASSWESQLYPSVCPRPWEQVAMCTEEELATLGPTVVTIIKTTSPLLAFPKLPESLRASAIATSLAELAAFLRYEKAQEAVGVQSWLQVQDGWDRLSQQAKHSWLVNDCRRAVMGDPRYKLLANSDTPLCKSDTIMDEVAVAFVKDFGAMLAGNAVLSAAGASIEQAQITSAVDALRRKPEYKAWGGFAMYEDMLQSAVKTGRLAFILEHLKKGDVRTNLLSICREMSLEGQDTVGGHSLGGAENAAMPSSTAGVVAMGAGAAAATGGTSSGAEAAAPTLKASAKRGAETNAECAHVLKSCTKFEEAARRVQLPEEVRQKVEVACSAVKEYLSTTQELPPKKRVLLAKGASQLHLCCTEVRSALSGCALPTASKSAIEAACAAAESDGAATEEGPDEAWKVLVKAIVPHVAKVDVPKVQYDKDTSCHGNAYQLWRGAFVRTLWNRALTKGMPSHLSAFVTTCGWRAIEASGHKRVYEDMWGQRVREIKAKKHENNGAAF